MGCAISSRAAADGDAAPPNDPQADSPTVVARPVVKVVASPPTEDEPAAVVVEPAAAVVEKAAAADPPATAPAAAPAADPPAAAPAAEDAKPTLSTHHIFGNIFQMIAEPTASSPTSSGDDSSAITDASATPLPESRPDSPESIPAANSSRLIQARPGDDPRLIFRPPTGPRALWKDVPVRELPTLPNGGTARKLMYLDDIGHSGRVKVMDSDLNLLHVLLRSHSYERAQSYEDTWSLWWHSGQLREEALPLLCTLKQHQKVNKFPGAGALTDKACLWESVRNMVETHGAEHFDFLPLTFVLPKQLHEYESYMRREVEQQQQQKAAKSSSPPAAASSATASSDGVDSSSLPRWDGNSPESVWILKPNERSRGTGIFLHRATAEARSTGGWGGGGFRGGVMPQHVRSHIGVASRYVHPPFLLEPSRLKFDLRIYVLLTSVHPLVFYVYREGLTRFATESYDLSFTGYGSSDSSLERRCMHLTNYSLNKKAKAFVPNTDEEADGVGSKWSLSAFRRRLASTLGGERAAKVWLDVDDLIVKTMISAEPTLTEGMLTYFPQATRGEPVRTCFQLFGFDVMLDAECKPWLLEVNCDPALGTDSPLDLKIKSSMLADAFNLIGLPITEAPPKQEESGKRTASQQRAAARAARMAEKEMKEEDPIDRWADGCRGGKGERTRDQLVEDYVIDCVDRERERSLEGGWRRLLPCKHGAERYLPWLGATTRQVGFSHPLERLNGLSFDLGKEGDERRSPLPKRQEKSRKVDSPNGSSRRVESPNATRRKVESPSASMRAKPEELTA